MGWIATLMSDKDYIIKKYGLKQFYKILFKLAWYLVLSPAIFLTLMFTHHWIIMFFYAPFMIYGFIVAIYGGNTIMKVLTQWQSERLLKRYEKELAKQEKMLK